MKQKEVEAWAKRPKSSTKCQTCQIPAAADACRTYLKVRAAGEATMSVDDLHALVCDEFGFPGSYNGLLRHLRQCERKLYAQRQPIKRRAD